MNYIDISPEISVEAFDIYETWTSEGDLVRSSFGRLAREVKDDDGKTVARVLVSEVPDGSSKPNL